MKLNSDYRQAARRSLKGKWAFAALVSFLFVSLCNVCQATAYSAYATGMTMVLGGLDSLYTLFFTLPASFAFLLIFLTLSRKPEINLFSSFVDHFTSNYGRALMSMLLLFVISSCLVLAGLLVSFALVSIPFTLFDLPFSAPDFSFHSHFGIRRMLSSLNLIVFFACSGVLFLLTLIPILMYLYKICLFPFIIEDNPDTGVVEAYSLSTTMMRGHRMQLFLLDFSFIGWYLLSVITFGIAVFWVIPYQQTARAHFYNDLKKEYDKRFTADYTLFDE